jgi:hypothetical protein
MNMTDRHEHLDEGTVHAWLDGALPPDESQRVETLTASCAECAAVVAEARGLVAASSRILASLDAMPGGVIPGAASGDQLAALRARRAATSRRWWKDPRVAVAASLLFVAGVSSLVWRSPGGEPAASRAAAVMDSGSPKVEQSDMTAEAPATSDVAAVRAATAREEKAVAPPPASVPAPPTVSAPSPRRLATRPAMDSALAQKTLATSVPAPVADAANEARRIDAAAGQGRVGKIDSASALSRLEQVTPQGQMRQQAAAPALQGLQQQLRADSAQRAAAPAFARDQSRRITTGAGAATSLADAVVIRANCFRLRAASGRDQGAAVVPDTVRLVDEMVPVLSDPSWFRVRTGGVVKDTTLAWRMVDSVTVELRSRFGSDSSAVRFTTSGAVPELSGLGEVRAAVAVRVICEL